MKYIKFIITGVIVAVLAFMAYSKLKANKEVIDEKAEQTEFVVKQIPVNTVSVASTKLSNEVELVGTFEARKELNVIAETQGRIVAVYVTEGQTVRKGQLIAKIDDSTIQSQLRAAQASIEKGKKDVERYQNLLKVGAISQTQYEEVELSLRNQESNVAAIQQQLQYTTAKSPMSGIVKEVILEEGSFATPSKEIASIIDINKLNMVVKMDEKEIVKIRKGKKVNILTDVYEEIVFTGMINQISVQADAARKYEVEIQVANNNSHPLKAGMYGTAFIPLDLNRETEVMTIPRKSVIGSVKNPQVYTIKDGKSTIVDIEVGENIEDMVVVLKGLQLGDEIITTGQINLQEGKEVRVITKDSFVNNK